MRKNTAMAVDIGPTSANGTEVKLKENTAIGRPHEQSSYGLYAAPPSRRLKRVDLEPGSLRASDRDGFEHLLRDVEVRVDVLNVVVVLELVDQAQNLLCRTFVCDLDRRLRTHRQLGGVDAEPRGLDRL